MDETGKKIRGKGPTSDNYDTYVIDIWKEYYPQPCEVKQASVYDYYDIFEEIGVYVCNSLFNNNFVCQGGFRCRSSLRRAINGEHVCGQVR